MKYCPNHSNILFSNEEFQYCPICRTKLISKEIETKYFYKQYSSNSTESYISDICVKNKYMYDGFLRSIDILKINDYADLIEDLKKYNVKFMQLSIDEDDDYCFFIRICIDNPRKTQFASNTFELIIQNIIKLNHKKIDELIILLAKNFKFFISDDFIEYIKKCKNILDNYNKFPDFIKLQMELK